MTGLVQSFATVARAYRHHSVDAQVAAWLRQVVEPHAELYESVEAWIDLNEAAQRLPHVIRRADSFVASERRALAAVDEAEKLLSRVIRIDQPIRTVVLVGLGQANGWVAEVRDAPTLFLAVENLPDPPFDVILAMHEIVHLLHARRAARDWPRDRVDADLFREGLAVHTTSTLLPAIEPSGHLWFRPGEQRWISTCEAMSSQLRSRALAELDRTDASAQWFSGAADRGGFPGRCGYWLGWRLVERMAATGSLDAAFGWPLIDVGVRLRDALEVPR